MEPDDIALLPALALRTFQLTFEREGLEFAAFLEGEDIDHENYSMSDSLDLVLSETSLAGIRLENAKEILVRMLRSSIYESTPAERSYLSKLCRTYLLLFSLNAEPRLSNTFSPWLLIFIFTSDLTS